MLPGDIQTAGGMTEVEAAGPEAEDQDFGSAEETEIDRPSTYTIRPKFEKK